MISCLCFFNEPGTDLIRNVKTPINATFIQINKLPAYSEVSWNFK